MFTEIGIENFKAFGKMQRIPLKPITLLYGPNSSGKSSLMQALLLFKQTLEEAGDDKIVLLPKGSLVDLGGYQEFINGHDVKKDFHLSISFKYFLDMYDGGPLYIEGEKDDLSLEFSFTQDESEEIVLKSIKMRESQHSDPLMVWKNVWAIPHLKSVVLKRKAEFEESDDDPETVKAWLSDLTKSVLVLDQVNLLHNLLRRQWEQLGRDSIKVHNGIKSRNEYGSLEHRLHKQTNDELNKLQLDIEKKSVDIEAESNKWNANYAELNDEERQENREHLLVKQARLQQLKTILELSIIINQSFISKSYEDILKINNFPISNRLLAMSNCFSSDKSELDGTEEWLFQSITEFAEMGKPATAVPVIYSYLNLDTFFSWASSLLKEYLRRIIYIGPLREYPERVYSYSGNIPSNVGKSGKYTPDILMKKPELVNKVNDWFARFEIDYKLNVDSLKRNLFALTLTDKRTGYEVSPKDVGFGIGQLLPIIVQGVLSENKIVCIEQPEIHIHPRLQAEFGSFVAEVASRANKEPGLMNDEGYGNQFIIETHSEHLILRLLKLIRDTTNRELKEGEKPLRPEDVAVIYAKPTEHGTELMELRISEDGDFIDKWPDGFFTERAKELF